MTLSQNNLIVIIWLQKIDPRLLKIVQQEYGLELRNNHQLTALAPRIANDMDTLLSKLSPARVSSVQEAHQVNRVFGRRDGGNNREGGSNSRGGGGNNRYPARNRGDRSDRRPENRSRDGPQLHCSHCKHLNKEMAGVTVPYDHGPLTCRRRKVHVRSVRNDEDEASEDYFQDAEDDYEESDGEIPHVFKLNFKSHSLQDSSRSEQKESLFVKEEDPGGGNHSERFIPCIAQPSSLDLPRASHHLLSDYPVKPLIAAVIQRVLSRLRLPTRARSPAILADLRGRILRMIIDSGSELNCISLRFAREMKIPFRPTPTKATGAGNSDIALAGVTTVDVIVYSVFNGRRLPINLQRAVVVDSLGVDVLAGEPAKQHNGLETNARKRNVSLRYDGETFGKPYLDSSRSDHAVAESNYAVAHPIHGSTVAPGAECRVAVPPGLQGQKVLLFTGRRDGPSGFSQGFTEVRDGHVSVYNCSSADIKVSRRKPVGELRSVCEVKIKVPSCPEDGSSGSGEVKKPPEKQKPQATVQDSVSNERQIPVYHHGEVTYSNNSIVEVTVPGSKGRTARTFSYPALVPAGFTESDSDTFVESSCSGRPSGGPGASSPGIYKETPAQKKKEAPSLSSNFGSEGKEPSPARAVEIRPLGERAGVARVSEDLAGGFKYVSFATPEPDPPREPDIIVDPDGVMTPTERARAKAISSQYYQLFTKRPGKYNGYSGRVCNAIEFSSPPTPNTKVYLPSYSSKQLEEMGRLMDTLVNYGVLQRPEDIGVTPVVVSPSLLVPKNDAGEYRLVTDLSGLNKHIKKFPSISPTIQEARDALARKKFFIHMDLANFFFQCGVENTDSKFLATFHPFKGLLVYVVTPQGMKNASEQGYEMLGRVFGDMVAEKKMVRQADSLFPQGDTVMECLDNYDETLRRAELNGLTFKPGKTIICPKSITLFGWRLDGSSWLPTPHTTSSLSVVEPPTTVKGLRSFLGSFKQFTECVPRYAVLLHGLEKLVGGRGSGERISWTGDNLESFDRAKAATADITAVSVPRPSDKLSTFSDFSADARAVGGRLEILRVIDGKEVRLHGGYFSVVLDKYKSHWVPCEAEAAGVRLTLQHFEPYIRENENITVHYTDNMPTVQAWRRCMQGKFSASSRISTFLVGLSSLSVELVYKPGKDMNSADFSSRNPVHCEESSGCQICKFAEFWQMKGDNSSNIGSLCVKDILEGKSLMPFIQLKTWLGQQLNDQVHVVFRRLVSTGQHPEKKKTCGDFTIIKHLYKKYQAGDVTIRPDGLVMVRVRDGHFGGFAVSVPHGILSGIAFSIHVKLNHPSKGQLLSLMSRYFYCHGHTTIIQSVVDNCVQCRSLQPLPKEFVLDTTERVKGLGTHFAVDVIERKGQKLLLTREKLSQYTWLELIPDQTTATFRQSIFRTVLPWIHPSGAVIRCDGAAALTSLATEAGKTGSLFFKYNIKIDVGRPHNVNKNAIAENAIKEAEKEFLKYRPEAKMLSVEDLAVVSKIMNDRVRNRGVTAKEILTKRDCLTNDPKDISDKELANDQFEKRLEANSRALDRKPATSSDPDFHVGDVVYVKGQRSKHQPREQFIVIEFAGDNVIVQKVHNKFGSKKYSMYKSELMPAGPRNEEIFQDNKSVVSSDSEDSAVPDTSSVSPPVQKKKRGRPRKSTSPRELPDLSPVDDENNSRSRPRRAAASRARERLRSNPEIQTVKEDEDNYLLSRIYRCGTTNYVCETEMVETRYIVDRDRHWLMFPPDVNYNWMEEDGWLMPNLEEWGEGDIIPGDDVQEILDGADMLAAAPLQESFSDVEDDSSEQSEPHRTTVEELSGDQSNFGHRLQQLSRHPESAAQVNTHRVVNLDSVLESVPQISDDPDSSRPRRSRAAMKKPARYDD